MTMEIDNDIYIASQRNPDNEMTFQLENTKKDTSDVVEDIIKDSSNFTENRLNCKYCPNDNIENHLCDANLIHVNSPFLEDSNHDINSLQFNSQNSREVMNPNQPSCRNRRDPINSNSQNCVEPINSIQSNSVNSGEAINSISSNSQDSDDPINSIHPSSQNSGEPINSIQPNSLISREAINSIHPISRNSGEAIDPITESCRSPYNSNLSFGWKCLSPKLLQFFNRPIFFLICLCFSGIAQGLVVTGISFTVLSSIEKQFGLKSSEVALFGTSYDIAYGICSVFVGYVGHTHKPRCISWGIIIMAVGAVTLSIPKFVFGTYEAGIERSSDFCNAENMLITNVGNTTNFTDDCTNTKEWYYQFIFITGNVLLGIGAIPLYTLAPAHIDDVTKRNKSSIYMGIYFGCCAVGPALGFMIGMPVLNAWVDLNQPADSSLLPSDTNWVGAWWLGYLIGAGLLLLPLIPMFGFANEFPNTEATRVRKLELDDTIEENMSLKHDLKSVWPATKALLKNPPFILISLSHSCECLAVGGFSTFLSKFVQTQFHFTASKSSLFTGIIVISGAAGGLFLGGYLVSRFSWNCKKILRSAAVMAFLATLCTAIALVGCNGRTVVGQQESSSGISYVFTNECNHGCQCITDFYKPICTVEDQKTYYSPCHAGCYKDDLIDKEFYNCTCFPKNITHAVNGRCTDDCTLFPLSVIGAIFLMLFTFMNNVPMLTATFRVVSEGQGSFAMGFQQIFIRFLGFIPAPIMFGSLIDKSCNLWQYDSCTQESTSCLEYDQAYFRYYMFTLGVVTKFLSFVFILMAYKLYRLPESRSSLSHINENVEELPKLAVISYNDVIKNENAFMDCEMTINV